MPLADISSLELWQPLCWVEWKHLCNFGRKHHEDQFCEIIIEFGSLVQQRCRFKTFLIWSSGDSFVQQSGTICAILVKGIMRYNSAK